VKYTAASASVCSADFAINSDADVIQLSSCTKIDGKITLGTGVNTVSLPTSLAEITGDLIASGATGLVSFEATGLTTIGGSFTLNGLTVLSTLSFPELQSVGDINWTTLPALQDLGFAKLSQAENVLITDTLLRSLNGINLVTAARFNINNNRYLKTVDVALSSVSDMLVLDANGKGVNASFPNLQWANNITVRDAGNMYFPVLEKINSSAAFVNNTFTSVDFPVLTEVGESFAIISSSKLTNILANSLESVGGTFQLANNTKLAIVDGFENLAVVGGAVDLSGVFTEVKLPALEDVRGGFNLQSTQTISCDLFDALKGAGVIKGDGYTCEGNKDTAESKTSGLGTNGNNTGNGAATFEVNLGLVGMAGAVVLLAL
jgi:hypothetical protein